MDDKLEILRQREKLIDFLLGTCMDAEGAAERLELSIEIDWEDELFSANIEQCQGCGWWMESCMLEEKDGFFLCEQCNPDSED